MWPISTTEHWSRKGVKMALSLKYLVSSPNASMVQGAKISSMGPVKVGRMKGEVSLNLLFKIIVLIVNTSSMSAFYYNYLNNVNSEHVQRDTNFSALYYFFPNRHSSFLTFWKPTPEIWVTLKSIHLRSNFSYIFSLPGGWEGVRRYVEEYATLYLAL